MAFTGLIGDFPVGQQFLWPRASASIGDFFDRPSWERPTGDNPFDEDSIYLADVFTGGTDFQGGFNLDDYGDGGPNFLGGIQPGYRWIPPSGDDSLGGGTVVLVDPDGTTHTILITDSRRSFYSIEVRDTDNELVSRVPKWISGKLKLQLDRASELEFTAVVGDEGVSDLARPNTIWVRDRWGFVVDTFQIQRRTPNGSGGSSYLTVFATGAISQLGEEVVLEYAGADIPVQDHVAALMALQQNANPLTIGTIESDIADISLPLFAADTNIHAALLSLQAALPKEQRGRIYVDPQRRLQWRLAVGDTTEQIITRTANVSGLRAEVDYTQLYNRVYLYGEGNDPTTRLTLVDAGEAAEYVENSDSITAYGLRTLLKQDRRVRNPETLQRIAARILEEFGTPPVNVDVDLLDIAKADDAPIGFADVYIGGKYRVVDTDLAVDSSIEIVGIEIDMGNPVPIRVELTNQRTTLGDLLARLVDALQQPLYVDGDRYPTMGRNYSAGVSADNLRAGDTRWNAGGDQAEMFDGDSWEPMGGGTPSDDPGTDISEEAAIAGVAEEYARADHTHKGMPFLSASSVASLPTDHESGVLGYVSSTFKQLWAYIDGQWVRITIPVVTSLPEIPEYGVAEVYWTSTGGNGDNQIWRAYAGQSSWTPTQKFTTKSGAPPS